MKLHFDFPGEGFDHVLKPVRQERRLPPGRTQPCWDTNVSHVRPKRMDAENLQEQFESAADLELARKKKRGGRKRNAGTVRRGMAVPELILEMQIEELRENALRCLSGYLQDKRESDPQQYDMAGFYLYQSFGTAAILVQEVLLGYSSLASGEMTVRSAKRLANVLTLFQVIAANDSTRAAFVAACLPDLLFPFILSDIKAEQDVWDNTCIVCLGVFVILCQAQEDRVISWALRNEMASVCAYTCRRKENELLQVACLYVLELLFENKKSLYHICGAQRNVLIKVVDMLNHMARVLAGERPTRVRVLSHLLRCTVLLSQHPIACSLLTDSLSSHLQDDTFLVVTKENVKVKQLQRQLLLNLGKAQHPQAKPLSSSRVPLQAYDANAGVLSQRHAAPVKALVAPLMARADSVAQQAQKENAL